MAWVAPFDDHASFEQDDVLSAGKTHAGLGELPRYQVVGTERRLSEYVRRYEGELRYLDDSLGPVFDALDRLGLANETLVVLTADHDEAFGEDGYYCAHGHGLGMDQTRVPLAFVGPGVAPGAVLEGPVSNLSFFATALDALGISGADPQQSHSLARALRTAEPLLRVGFAESVTQRADAFAEQIEAVRRGERELDDGDLTALRALGYVD